MLYKLPKRYEIIPIALHYTNSQFSNLEYENWNYTILSIALHYTNSHMEVQTWYEIK